MEGSKSVHQRDDAKEAEAGGSALLARCSSFKQGDRVMVMGRDAEGAKTYRTATIATTITREAGSTDAVAVVPTITGLKVRFIGTAKGMSDEHVQAQDLANVTEETLRLKKVKGARVEDSPLAEAEEALAEGAPPEEGPAEGPPAEEGLLEEELDEGMLGEENRPTASEKPTACRRHRHLPLPGKSRRFRRFRRVPNLRGRPPVGRQGRVLYLTVRALARRALARLLNRALAPVVTRATARAAVA
eukprot:jgi/Undpi1/13944/HiC_scaffold_9.g03595.m1